MSHKYTIHHLEFSLLREVNMKLNEVPDDLRITALSLQQLYRTLIDKRSLRTAVRARDSESVKRYWSKIGGAAEQLLRRGWYKAVANVQGEKVFDAIKKTSSRQGLWFLTVDPTIELLAIPVRDTAPLDVIEVAGCKYLYCSGGYWSLDRNCFMESVNEG